MSGKPVPPKLEIEPKLSVRPTIHPLLSKYPRLVPVMSLVPFISSLRPGAPDPRFSVAPEPEANANPNASSAAQPISPKPSRVARGRSLMRRALVPAAAVAIAATAFVAARGDLVGKKGPSLRGAGAPTLKTADDGAHVRWQRDAIDVVVDKSFTDLAGPQVFGAAVDAWRQSGAMIPSISTAPGDSKQVGYRADGPNENVVVFAPYGWQKAHGALAVTVVTYDNKTGTIVDADLLVNGGGRFFANFDKDESDESDDDTSIDSAAGSETSSTSKSKRTPRYDVQAVVTHELGHFFGLGEDYEDAKTTMYTKTRAGEIHKRLLKQSDADVITALYAESPSEGTQVTKAGCGGAHIARGGAGGTVSWVGFAAATLGLGLLAASRRTRADELRVRAVSRRPMRRVARLGSWLTAFGLLAFLAPPEVRAATGEVEPRGDAEVQVVAASPRWVDGLLETDLTFHITTCHVTMCPDTDQHAVVSGGNLGGLTQIVGPFAVPEVGAQRAVMLRDGQGLLQRLRPTIKL